MTVVGSICSGYAGMEMGLTLAGVDHTLAYVADPSPYASAALQAHHPNVPNLGDITLLDTLPACDVLTAGFPCQPVSQAGARSGVGDERWIWGDIVRLVETMDAPPGVLFLENVQGVLSANEGEAFRQILEGLALVGYDAEWIVVRASEAGAPHVRARWFAVAWRRVDGRTVVDAYADRIGWVGWWPALNSTDGGLEVEHGHDPAGRTFDFGEYQRVIDRWAEMTRPVPYPLTDRNRIEPAFSEWLMGLPAGWCSDLDLDHKHIMGLIGNGVCPQQAALAWWLLTAESTVVDQPALELAA